MKYAALIPCGPAPEEVARVADLLSAFDVLDPVDCLVALILDDGNPGLAALPRGPRVRIEPNPRQGKGWGWAGGLIAAELWSFALLLREYPAVECVVKLDTDALPIKPLGPGLAAVFSDERAGYAGERTGYDPFVAGADGRPRPERRRTVRKLRALVSLWRMPHWHVRQSLMGHHRWIASLFSRAELQDYEPGDVVEGGACAFSRACLEHLAAAGVLARWRDFLDISSGDDLVLTMLPYLVGMRAVSTPLFSPGDQRALKFSPESLLAHPVVGAVHSVKKYGMLGEEELRRIFREHRLTAAPR